MAEMTLDRLETLEQVMRGCLAQAALFRQALVDGTDTGLVQEYDGMCQMLTDVCAQLMAFARQRDEDYASGEAAYEQLLHRMDPHLY